MLTDTLSTIASKTSRNVSTVFSDFLDYVTHFFDPSGQPFSTWPYPHKDDINRLFLQALQELAQTYSDELHTRNWCDPLGDTFMALLGRYDIQRNAVFFTPVDVSSLMARLAGKPCTCSHKTFCGAFGYRSLCSDPTSGSGRNLLAVAASYAGRPRTQLPYFIGEDINDNCAKMTAINLMFHGLPGEAVCHDSLSQPHSLRFGFVVNEGLFPVSGGMPSIRRFTEPSRFVLFSAHKKSNTATDS